MNYLASPPLVVAYALAGTMDLDLDTEPLGIGADGEPVFLRDIWPSPEEIAATWSTPRSGARCSSATTPTCSRATTTGARCRSRRATPSSGTRPPPTSARPPTSRACPSTPEPVTDIAGARVLAKLGDSVTTDHISPAGSIKAGTPAAEYLREHGVEVKDFNSYGSRRGNHEVMIRGTFANIRLRNQIAPRHRGRLHPRLHPGRRRRCRSSTTPRPTTPRPGTPLVVLAGKEYGSGSSRDWAAKGTALLGVRAVIAESYERIHRSNLIGMGVLPLQFPEGGTAESLGLTGEETFEITGVEELNEGGIPRTVHVKAGDVEFDAVRAHRHARRGRLLPARRHHAVRPALAARQVLTARPGVPGPRSGHEPGRGRRGPGRLAAGHGRDPQPPASGAPHHPVKGSRQADTTAWRLFGVPAVARSGAPGFGGRGALGRTPRDVPGKGRVPACSAPMVALMPQDVAVQECAGGGRPGVAGCGGSGECAGGGRPGVAGAGGERLVAALEPAGAGGAAAVTAVAVGVVPARPGRLQQRRPVAVRTVQ